jgi:PadR family transcriptional regulator PadR
MLGHVELRPPGYFTLAALIDGPLHGYAIMRRASELSDGSVRVSTGTLYSVLDRALAEGLVTAADPYVVAGRERRDYSLTPAGRLVLQEETARLARAASVVGTRLKATGALATCHVY